MQRDEMEGRDVGASGETSPRESLGAGGRLPPPAFPPGNRRDWVHRPRTRSGRSAEAGDGGIPDDALLDPGEPIRRIETLTDRGEENPTAGMGMEPSSGHPVSLEEVASILERLAREVRGHSGGRFLWKADVTPLEGALRGLLSGYLRLGRRVGEGS
jgi:hypothetical protein